MSSILDQREEDSESGLRKSQNGFNISRLDSEGSKTLAVIYRKVSEKIRSNRSIYGKSEWIGRVRKVMEGTRMYPDDPGCLMKSGGFRNRCIHVAFRGKEFPFKANSDLVKEVDFW
jgi:hypothetical protein